MSDGHQSYVDARYVASLRERAETAEAKVERERKAMRAATEELRSHRAELQGEVERLRLKVEKVENLEAKISVRNANVERLEGLVRRDREALEEARQEIAVLRGQMRGVFCVNTGVTPPPGPRTDTPAERLRQKRRQEVG